MKKLLPLLFSLVIATSSYAEGVMFASKPSLTPDGSTIYFSYAGDIFKVPADGGLALRVVSMGGMESNPRISPDGKYLAFSSNEAGNNNIYVVPVKGGDVRQLTFHDAGDIPVSWSPDSKNIYFESGRYNSISAYSVSVEGGTPKRLFSGFFNTIAGVVENPVTGDFYFTESTESYRYATRKGYKGEHNPNIISWNPYKKEYKEVTTYFGKDIWPMVDAKGTLYYVSDEKIGEANIVKHEEGKRRWITNFDESVQYPAISADGSKIVYIKGYKISLTDLRSGKSSQPVIEVVENRIVNDFSVKIEVPQDASVSPDGKKLAFVFRGALFVCDAKGNFVRQLRTPANERVDEVLWADDSKGVYYTRTNFGFTNIFKQRADLPAEEKVVFVSESNARSLTLSHKGKLVAFINGSGSVMTLNLSDDKCEEVAKGEFWAFQGYSLSFSSNDKFLAFSAVNLFERDIFITALADKKTVNLTNSATYEDEPVFSPDGRYIYFTADRYNPSFPRGTSFILYKVPLDKFCRPFEGVEFEKLFGKTTASVGDSSVVINRDYLQRRYERVVGRGTQSSPFIFTQREKTFLFFSSNHEGEQGLYVQEIKDWDQKPAQRVKGLSSADKYISNGKDMLVLCRDGLYKLDPASAAATKIEIKHTFPKNMQSEFNQMFYEVWATLAQNFYDVRFHGVDWKAKRDYYAGFLPMVKSRDELRTLINDMLNELNSSHMGFNSSGKEEDVPERYTSAETGLMFDNDNPFVVDRIIAGSRADYTGNPLKKGDRLVAVNGVRVDFGINREKYFVSPVGKSEILLTFERAGEGKMNVKEKSDLKGKTEFDIRLHTMSSGEIRSLLYTEWEDTNRALVDKLGNGRIAYVHMRDMSADALNGFLLDMNTYAVHKDALILDLRFNNGGNVHKEVLDYLAQKQHFKWSYRTGQPATHPNVTPGDKPIIVLINERSLSDAEVTSNGIKTLSLAKLVGTETYRWIIFTSGARMIDGSSVRLPAWGCYSLDGKDLESTGVKPDIYVKNTFRDRLESKDPQLERAIKELLPL